MVWVTQQVSGRAVIGTHVSLMPKTHTFPLTHVSLLISHLTSSLKAETL